MARVSFGPFPQRVALTALQQMVEGVARGEGIPPGTRNLPLTETSFAALRGGWLAGPVSDDELMERYAPPPRPARPPSSGTRHARPSRCCAPSPTPPRSSASTSGTSTPRRAGRRGRATGRRAARQAGRGVLPERDHGPAGRAAGLVRPHRLQAGRDPRPLPPAQARGRRTAAPARLRVRPPHHRPRDGEGRRPAALGPGLGAALVELPLRDAGCLLPTWEELGELSEAARELGVPLHADGARIWESQPF